MSCNFPLRVVNFASEMLVNYHRNIQKRRCGLHSKSKALLLLTLVSCCLFLQVSFSWRFIFERLMRSLEVIE